MADQLVRAYPQGEDEVLALAGVSLTIAHGAWVAITGSSGSGKSTLLNLLGCLDRPTRGRLEIDGHDVSSLDDEGLARMRNRHLGFVFQQFHLLPRTTAEDNVALPLVYAGIPRAERIARAREVLDRVGLADRRHHWPSQLSGGQQQRVAIARALVTRPTLLLADEPTGALDSRTGQEILDLFADLHQRGATVVMVTHDHGVAACAERRVVLADGRIARDDGKVT
ncbi:MAG: ABC transporter ATP-binding protein [Candidatus Sericytochromatia bacterium]|nr:ABC transporter ATP-binding protein [Candidatus Sericytochromatia bacterium]